MGLLDALSGNGDANGGLLSFLQSLQQPQQVQSQTGPLSPDMMTPYGGNGAPQAPVFAQAPMPPVQQNAQPSLLDNAQWPAGPMGAPQQNPQPSPLDTARWPSGPIGAPSQANAQMTPNVPQQPPAVIQAQQNAPQDNGILGHIGAALQSIGAPGSLFHNVVSNPINALITGQTPADVVKAQQAQVQNLTGMALLAKNVDPQIVRAAIQPGNHELLKALVESTFKNPTYSSAGGGNILNSQTGKVSKEFEPDDKTPQSVLEYKYYTDNLPKGQPPMDYATWSTAKARAGATNVSTNVDMNSGQTYDKQLAEGLGKAHASLANGVEDSQARARDIAAMQGAIDTIQKNGGTTGGLGQQQIQDLKKTINAGSSAIGIEKPFDEGDLSDKEFLTKFNRQMAGAQAKGAVGSRVTNFEMQNYLKANPGLDMTVTGNQRLLGIQSQIEQRNIAVGNQIRDATAAAISRGTKIDPVTVQKIITDYDSAHHIKDPMNGQDLTQSYALPEFQKPDQGTNAGLAAGHETNMKKVRRYNPATGALE